MVFRFGEKHPVAFEIILFSVAIVGAAIVAIVGGALGMQEALASSIGRMVVAGALFLVFRRVFEDNRFFPAPAYLLPALLFAVWNLYYNLSSGMRLGGYAIWIEAVVTAIAPAVFEELIFRGIFVYNLKQKGHGDLACLLISAGLFAVAHITNAIGLDAGTVALQVVYSFVVGLAFGAVYIQNRSIVQVILAHFLTDFTNRLFFEQATTATTLHVVLFVVLLIGETVYAIWLAKNRGRVTACK